MIGILGAVAGAVLVVGVLIDAFETMLLPRRVSRVWRPTRLFYRSTWVLWGWVGRRFPQGRWRHHFLSLFGPLSLLGLLVCWALCLVVGFGVIHWSLETSLTSQPSVAGLPTYLYFSGVTFFTLGYGDLSPTDPTGRFVAVIEAGIGFGFLAVVIGYLPVLYQAFSRREVSISLLDARAGSPPTAAELLRRLALAGDLSRVSPLLAEWERWSAELLESHLSFPVLSYYRSQHDNQSWLAALTAVLDTCAVLIVAARDIDSYQAQLTFAMARHAVVDMALVFGTPPKEPDPDRLPPEQCRLLKAHLQSAGVTLQDGDEIEPRLAEMRHLYEPFVNALADYFQFSLPPVVPDRAPVDNWQTSAWTRRTPGFGRLSGTDDQHFD